MTVYCLGPFARAPVMGASIPLYALHICIYICIYIYTYIYIYTAYSTDNTKHNSSACSLQARSCDHKGTGW